MRLPLVGKAYQGRSVIASAQKTINLYAELNTADKMAPAEITYYPLPGTTLYSTPVNAAKCRCTYRTSIGTAYVVIGPAVYFLAANTALVFVGSIPDRTSQVVMADNGLALVIVDGSAQGWAINLATNAFGAIIDPSFYGGDAVVFLDTFFVFNRPGTNQFYISLGMVTYALLTAGNSFDPLDIAAKSGSADPIKFIATAHKELWLIGELTTEIWIGTGAADFFFQLVQGAFIEHGCIAKYSVANQDVIVFWLMQNRQGKCIVLQGAGYQTKEISTPFLVDEFTSYADVSDAIGCCFQIGDHSYYCLIFPTANKTWLYDLTTDFWCEWSFLDIADGSYDRHRINCCMFVYGEVLIGDWENGKLYKLSINVYTDTEALTPIIRVKTFAHLVKDLDRINYLVFNADMEVGRQDPIIEQDPTIDLSWSDDRGVTYGFPVTQTLGKGGEFLTIVSWNRLGQARDRIFKLQWSAAVKTALQGAFIQSKKART